MEFIDLIDIFGSLPILEVRIYWLCNWWLLSDDDLLFDWMFDCNAFLLLSPTITDSTAVDFISFTICLIFLFYILFLFYSLCWLFSTLFDYFSYSLNWSLPYTYLFLFASILWTSGFYISTSFYELGSLGEKDPLWYSILTYEVRIFAGGDILGFWCTTTLFDIGWGFTFGEGWRGLKPT